MAGRIGRRTFPADPVAIPGTERRVVLCESLDHAVGRGRIARLEMQSVDTPELETVIETVFEDPTTHFSYPSLTRLPSGELLCT